MAFSTVIGNLVARLRLDTAEFDGAVNQSVKKLTQTGAAFNRLGTDLTRNVTVPLTALAAGVIKVGSDFESAFAGVRKTVTATEPEFAVLRQGFRDLAKEIPIAATELAGIGEAAGQLGIRTENILGFTRVMADLGVTTNLSAQEAATALARLSNIMGTNQTDFDRLGSVIVDLGNNFATTEREIVEMGLRLAGAGKQIGLSESQVLGFAAALTSVGIEAEAGGTAFSRVFNEIEKSIATGSKELAGFAAVAGTSVPEFSRLFREDAGEAITRFVEGLLSAREQGQSVTVILEALGIEGIRVSDSLKRTANAGDLVRDALDRGATAWRENTALTKEAEERYKTFESQVILLWNALKDVGVTLFDAIRPVLVETVIPALKEAVEIIAFVAAGFAALPSPVKTFTVVILAAVAALGPFLYAIGQVIFLWKNIVTLAPAVAAANAAVAASQTAAAGASTAAAAANAAAAGSSLGLVGVLRTVAAFLTGPFGLALAAGSAAVIYFREEIGALIATWGEFLGLWETSETVMNRARREVEVSAAAVSRLAEKLGLNAATVQRWIDTNSHAITALADNRAKVDELKAAYDRGTLSKLEYIKALQELIKGQTEAKATTSGVTVDMGALAKALEDAAKKAGGTKDALKQYREAAMEALDPTAGLAAEIAAYQKLGLSAGEISIILRDRIREVGERSEAAALLARQLGIDLPTTQMDAFAASVLGAAGEIDKLRIASEAYQRHRQELSAAVRDGTALVWADVDATLTYDDSIRRVSDSTLKAYENYRLQEDQTRALITTIGELNEHNYSAEQINRAVSISVKQLIADAEHFGIEIDENTRKMLEQIGAIQANQKAGTTWAQVWTQAIGNVVSGFARGVADMIFEGRSFADVMKGIFIELAKALIQIMVVNLFTKLLGLFGGFGAQLAQALGGGIGGIGGGGGGILSAVLGGGGSAAGAAGGAAGAAGAAAGGGAAAGAAGGGGGAGIGAGLVAGGIAAAAVAAGAYFWYRDKKNPFNLAVQEIKRDFGIDVPKAAVEDFVRSLGLTTDEFAQVRKDVLSSGAALQELLIPYAKLQNQTDLLIQRFGRLQAFGQTFNLAAEAAAALAGNFDAFNQRFLEIFGNSALLAALLPAFAQLLTGVNIPQAAKGAIVEKGGLLRVHDREAVIPLDRFARISALQEEALARASAAAAAASSARQPRGDSGWGGRTTIYAPVRQEITIPITIEGTPSDELQEVVDSVVVPRIEVLMRQGTGGLRRVMTEFTSASRQGIVRRSTA